MPNNSQDCYANRQQSVVETRTEEEMILGLRKKLLEAVEIRLRADVSIGVYLSGGIDSAIIAGIAAHVAKEQGWKHRLNCYTIGFEEGTEFDETGKHSSSSSSSSSFPSAQPPQSPLPYSTLFNLSKLPHPHSIPIVIVSFTIPLLLTVASPTGLTTTRQQLRNEWQTHWAFD